MAKNPPPKPAHKRASDHSRPNYFAVEPELLTIVGGKHVLQGDEASDLDTEDGPEHYLYDQRLENELGESFIENIDRFGVKTAIRVIKVEDRFLVVAGRRRVRAARVANKRREKRGEPLLKISYALEVRERGQTMLGALTTMLSENAQREADGARETIDKVKRFVDLTNDIDTAATVFNLEPAYIKRLLRFDDTASATLIAAVDEERIGLAAALTLASLSPDQQAQAIERGANQLSPSTGPKRRAKPISARAAKALAQMARGTISHPPLVKNEVPALLKHVQGMTEEHAEARVLVVDHDARENIQLERPHVYGAFLLGIEAALQLQLGTCDQETVLEMLKAVRAQKNAKKAAASAEDEDVEAGDDAEKEEP